MLCVRRSQMAGVPETAICYHKDGVVQSYNVVPTEDLPSLASEPFSPFVLEQNAATLLKFLQVRLPALVILRVVTHRQCAKVFASVFVCAWLCSKAWLVVVGVQRQRVPAM